MKITLSGRNGKMGSYIWQSLHDQFEFGENGSLLIDFSHADIAYDIIKKALMNKQKVISGTTNIDSELLNELKRISIENETSFIWVPNFSIGAIITYDLLNGIDGYFDGVSISETHSISKADCPSGTAKEYAEILHQRKIESKRIETSLAIHEVVLHNLGEKLTIIHTIENKDAFMNGLNFAIKKINEIDYVLVVGLDDFLELLKLENKFDIIDEGGGANDKRTIKE